MDELEKENKSGYPTIEFVYEEEDADVAEKKEEREPEGKSGGKSLFDFGKFPIGNVLLGVLGIVLGLSIGLFMKQDKEQADETSGVADETPEEINGLAGNMAMKGEYWQKLWQYLWQEHGADVPIEQDRGSGAYALGTYIICDLDGDGIYPEAVGVIWDIDLEQYELVRYFYTKDGRDDIVREDKEIEEFALLGGVAALVGDVEVEGLLLNHIEEGNNVDVIVTGRDPAGNSYSVFYRRGQDMLGAIEGIPALQTRRVENGQVESIYDIEGTYQIEKEWRYGMVPYFSFSSSAKAVTDYTVSEKGYLYSDMYTSGGKRWRLEGMPVWYLRRPLLVYPMDMQFDSVKVLNGKWIRIIGVLENANKNYYQVETDRGEMGWIPLSNIESLQLCQVQLQHLPFEEVFTVVETEEWTDELTEPFLPFLSAPGQIRMDDTQSDYEAWCDLNGDGIWEKLTLAKDYYFNGSELYVQLQINGTGIVSDSLNLTVNTKEELTLLILDMDETDSMLEVGYSCAGYGTTTRLYRYDGKLVWDLKLNDVLRWNSTIQWFSPEGEPIWRDGKIAVTAREAYEPGEAYNYEYSIEYDVLTGKFIREDVLECKLETPLQAEIGVEQPLYEDMNSEVVIATVEPWDGVTFDYFYLCTDNDIDYYIGHFICKNGVSGYSAKMDKWELSAYFGVGEFFRGTLAG